MRTLIAAAALAALVCSGCANHGDGKARRARIASEAVEASRETFALGTTLTEDGAVPQDAAAESFRRGHEIFLSIDVAGASIDQNIAVEWIDQSGHVVRREARDVPEGSRYTAFSSGRGIASTPGQHRAIVIINGRKVMEKAFTVV